MAINQEQDNVVVGFHDHVAVGYQDLFTAHNGTDRHAVGQADLIESAADDFRGLLVAVGDDFDRLSRSAAQ